MNKNGSQEGMRSAAADSARAGAVVSNPQARPEARDEVDLARAQQYGLLASLLIRAPDAQMLARLARLQGTATPVGLTHIALAEAAAESSTAQVQREFFDLFIGLGRGELVPFASFYLTGFLNDRPLAALRGDLASLGLERAEGHREPEDHIATLCEIMGAFAGGALDVPEEEQIRFFGRYVAPWAARFFADLETAESAKFYRAVGAMGRLFIEIEMEAFAMDR